MAGDLDKNTIELTHPGIDAIVGLAGDLATNPAALYLANLRTETGRYQMMRKLDKVAGMLAGMTWDAFPWASLTAAHVAALVTKLAGDYRPSYVNGIRAAIRGVVEQAHDHGQMSDRTYRLIRKVKAVRGNAQVRGRYVPQGELAAMMSECLADKTDAGRRDAAILACGYPGGLRRAEIASLRREDLQEDDDGTMTLTVAGKGGKARSVYLDNGGASALRDWLTVRGDEDGPLFWAGRRGGHLVHESGLSAQAVYNMLRRRAKAAGVRDLGAHDLRRTTASDLLDITDAVTVAGVLGHASTDTTARYDRRGERARRKASRGLHIAYGGRVG